MSFDLKLGMIYYGLAAAIVIVLALAALMRFIINRAFAVNGHAFYVEATHKEPECATCPFNKRCPYSNGSVCRFASKGGKVV